MRGFIPVALSSLMKGGLKSILVGTAKCHSREKLLDLVKLGQGVMPASFKVHHRNTTQKTESSLSDTSIEKDVDFWEPITKRIRALSSRYPDFPRLHGIYSRIASNRSSVRPNSISDRMLDFMSSRSGHMFDNCGPARMNLSRSFGSGSSADDFSMILQRMTKESIKESGADNTSVISLDSLEEFLVTYPNGIGRLRRFCELNGLRFDLSTLFGTNKVMFTTPPAGCFTFTFQYLGRALDIYLSGRNLYVMGWRNPNGTFEIKSKGEKGKNFMPGEETIVVQFKKNYRFLTPNGDVGEVRLGIHALREAFEVLHKSNGETYVGRLAVGTFAVHASEAGRLQGVFKDAIIAALESWGTVGSENRFWIQRYDHYSEIGMQQIDALLNGETPPDIEACEKAVEAKVEISQEIILNQIRIFPIDAYTEGQFAVPPNQSENNSVVGNDSCSKSSKGEKSAKKGWSSKQDQRKMKSPGLEEVPTGDGGSSVAVPLYLLQDWSSPQDKEEEQAEVKVVGNKR